MANNLTVISLKNKRKKTSDCKYYQTYEREKKIFELSLELNYFLFSCGKKIKRLVLENKDDSDKNIKNFEIKYDDNTSSEIMQVRRCSDKNNLSARCYSSIRKDLDLEEKLPPEYQKRVANQKINNQEAFKPSKNDYGFYIKNIQEKFKFVLQKIIESGYKGELTKAGERIINIKLAGDGKSINHSNVEILNVTFTVVYEGSQCKSEEGNYKVGINYFTYKFRPHLT